MYRLIRLTSQDYRNYRKVYSNIKYSFFKKGEEKPYLVSKVREALMAQIKGKGDYLSDIEDPNQELYFLEIDGNIQGFVQLIFHHNFCNIYEFAVFEHYKGWGTLLYDEVLKIVREKGLRWIKLYCPFDGAKVFWLKKGFSPRANNLFEKRIK